MWKEYSRGYIRNNRASGISVMAAAFIAALFLSFLCSVFYNMWVYDIERIVMEEGDWQGRITGNLSEADLTAIENFGNVEHAAVNEALSGDGETAVDIRLYNARTIFQDMPMLTRQLGLEEDAAGYHVTLLSQYLIHDPRDETPPLLLMFYLAVLLLVSLSLILIIHNSFAVSMNARIRQFGILSSVGATPAQIRTCLIQEAAALCLAPILLGSLLGTALSAAAGHGMDLIAAEIPGRHKLELQYHPLVFAGTLFASFLTVLFSAWIPARKLSRMTPLEAIRSGEGLQLKKRKRSPVLSLLFGLEGELAGNALKAQRSALRTSTLSLTLSFLGFTLILGFFTLSEISTGHTYFERYQDAWDVMVTVKDTKIEDFDLTGPIAALDGVEDCAVYQKAEALCRVPEEAVSGELAALGGPSAVAGASVTDGGGFWLAKAPVTILDDGVFASYCGQIGATPRPDGTVVLNRIWDNLNSNFRYPRHIPYVKEGMDSVTLQNARGEGTVAGIPVAAYTRKAPLLREEYASYGLCQFVPASLWKQISEQLGGAEPDVYIRILAGDGADLAELERVERELKQLLQPRYEIEIENRIQEKITNDYMIWGYKVILGGLCVLLAIIGIANVFSNTMGFLRQRKREFARYMSVGMTPESMRKMFCIEALVIAGRPVLITVPLTVTAIGYMIKSSYLDPVEYMAKVPLVPSVVFGLAILVFVGLAYYLGGKRVMECSLVDALRDDVNM